TEAAAAAEPAPEKPPAGAAEEDEGLRPGGTQATVTRVVDGDTIDAEYLAGAELPATRVRLIGVDTPEVHGQTEAYGAGASAFAEEQLTGKTVWLERDVSDTDSYGRAFATFGSLRPRRNRPRTMYASTCSARSSCFELDPVWWTPEY